MVEINGTELQERERETREQNSLRWFSLTIYLQSSTIRKVYESYMIFLIQYDSTCIYKRLGRVYLYQNERVKSLQIKAPHL